jgi:hypothetical protein
MTLALLCPKEQHTPVSVYGKKEEVLMMCDVHNNKFWRSIQKNKFLKAKQMRRGTR